MNWVNSKKELERFKTEINMVRYLEGQGYSEFDQNKSSKSCVILRSRNNNGKIGVTRGLDGHWIFYDFRCGDGGSIIDYLIQRRGNNLGKIRKELREVLSSKTTSLSHAAPSYEPRPTTIERMNIALEYTNTSLVDNRHTYQASRRIDYEILKKKRFIGVVTVDKLNNACFPYFDIEGIAVIEQKNYNYKGYTTGGSKGLWRSNLNG
jgi:hypothetical protein